MMTQAEFLSKVKEELKDDCKVTLDTIKMIFEAGAVVTVNYMNENKTTDDECRKNTSVRVPGFGSAYLLYCDGRKGVNPRNPKESLTIDPFYRMSFSFSQQVKDAYNDKAVMTRKHKKVAEEVTEKKAAKPTKKAPKRVIIEDEDDDD